MYQYLIEEVEHEEVHRLKYGGGFSSISGRVRLGRF